jgi:hypothetical protein
MKIGDLVKWRETAEESRLLLTTGIVVDGPRDARSTGLTATSYAVAWFVAKTTFWHHESNLEVISENR